jgi:O-antigen ligase
MIADIDRNPLVGHGQDAYLRHMENPGEEGAHNFPIEVLHATGVFGFLAYLLMHFLAPAVAVAALVGRRVPDQSRIVLIAVLGSYAAILAASATNIIYWNPTYWVFLAMMVAAVRLSAGE